MYIDQDKQTIVEEIRANLAGILADLRHMKAACDRIINYQPPRVSKALVSYRSPRASMAPVVKDAHPDVHKFHVISHTENEQGSTDSGNDIAKEIVSDVVFVTDNVVEDLGSTEISSMKVLEDRVQFPTMAEWVDAKIQFGWGKTASFSNNGASPNYLGRLVKDNSPGLSMQTIAGKSVEYFLMCSVVSLLQLTFMHHVPANSLHYLANNLVCGWSEIFLYYVVYVWSFDPGITHILLCVSKDCLLVGKIQEVLALVSKNVSLMSSVTTHISHVIELVDEDHLLLLDGNASFLVNNQFNTPLAFKGGTCSTTSSVCTSYRTFTSCQDHINLYYGSTISSVIMLTSEESHVFAEIVGSALRRSTASQYPSTADVGGLEAKNVLIFATYVAELISRDDMQIIFPKHCSSIKSIALQHRGANVVLKKSTQFPLFDLISSNSSYAACFNGEFCAADDNDFVSTTLIEFDGSPWVHNDFALVHKSGVCALQWKWPLLLDKSPIIVNQSDILLAFEGGTCKLVTSGYLDSCFLEFRKKPSTTNALLLTARSVILLLVGSIFSGIIKINYTRWSYHNGGSCPLQYALVCEEILFTLKLFDVPQIDFQPFTGTNVLMLGLSIYAGVDDDNKTEGVVGPEVTDEVRMTDTRADESFKDERIGNEYLIDLIDSHGHVDFLVTTALLKGVGIVHQNLTSASNALQECTHRSITASAVPSFLMAMARDHTIQNVTEIPVVISYSGDGIEKTLAAITVCKSLGLHSDSKGFCSFSLRQRLSVGYPCGKAYHRCLVQWGGNAAMNSAWIYAKEWKPSFPNADSLQMTSVKVPGAESPQFSLALPTIIDSLHQITAQRIPSALYHLMCVVPKGLQQNHFSWDPGRLLHTERITGGYETVLRLIWRNECLADISLQFATAYIHRLSCWLKLEVPQKLWCSLVYFTTRKLDIYGVPTVYMSTSLIIAKQIFSSDFSHDNACCGCIDDGVLSVVHWEPGSLTVYSLNKEVPLWSLNGLITLASPYGLNECPGMVSNGTSRVSTRASTERVLRGSVHVNAHNGLVRLWNRSSTVSHTALQFAPS